MGSHPVVVAVVPTTHATVAICTSTPAIAIVVDVAVVGDNAAAGLDAQVVRNGVVDVAQLCIAVGVLAILIPLAVALVLEVAALLRFEPLVDRPELHSPLRLLHLTIGRRRLLGSPTHWHHWLLRGERGLRCGATHHLRRGHILDVGWLLRGRHLHLGLLHARFHDGPTPAWHPRACTRGQLGSLTRDAHGSHQVRLLRLVAFLILILGVVRVAARVVAHYLCMCLLAWFIVEKASDWLTGWLADIISCLTVYLCDVS